MKILSRLGGVLYLVIIVLGIFGELFVRGQLVVSGNPIATANHIAAHEGLWRMGIVGDLLMHVCDIPLMWIFYLLLKPVNVRLALLALLFNLVQTAVLVVNKLNLVMVLFSVRQPELAYNYVKLHSYGFSTGLIFFGFACLVYGYLIYRSTQFPKVIGILMQLAGFCYLVSSFSTLSGFGNLLQPWVLLPPFIAELSLCLWLLIKAPEAS